MTRCPTARPVQRLTLLDWRLEFHDLATIVPYRGARVDGALYRIQHSDIPALDFYEGVKVGLYHRRDFLSGHGESVFCYYMNTGQIFPPSWSYFDTILAGFVDWAIPTDSLWTALNHSKGNFKDDIEDEKILAADARILRGI